MSKYMVTVQHAYQKVAYIEFMSQDDDLAVIKSRIIFEGYKEDPAFMPKYPYESGNFWGRKPPIIDHWLSKWIPSDIACNAWGRPCGGYWGGLDDDNEN